VSLVHGPHDEMVEGGNVMRAHIDHEDQQDQGRSYGDVAGECRKPAYRPLVCVIIGAFNSRIAGRCHH
jgi:hypothetical protein